MRNLKTRVRALCLTLAAASLLAAPASHAVLKKKQQFSVDSAFIDFEAVHEKLRAKSKPGIPNLKELGKIKKTGLPKGKKKNSLKLNFLDLEVLKPGDKRTVGVEMVALSLTSIDPVDLGPLGGTRGVERHIFLELDKKKKGTKKKKYDQSAKGQGLMDLKFDINLKIKADDKATTGKALPPKKLPSLSVAASGVPFSQNSPVRATSSFCLGNGAAIGFCVTPLNSVPEPATLAMFGFGAAGLVAFGWRRKSRARRGSGGLLAGVAANPS